MTERCSGEAAARSPGPTGSPSVAQAPVDGDELGTVDTAVIGSDGSTPAGASKLSGSSIEVGVPALSPVEALYAEEAERARMLAWFMLSCSVLVAAMLTFTGGDDVARWLHLAGVGLCGLGAAAVLVGLGSASDSEATHTLMLGLAGAFAVGTGFYYWGIFAPVVLVVPTGLYLIALGRSRSVAVAVAAVIIGTHAVVSIGVISGLLDDVGTLRPVDVGVVAGTFVAMYIELVFAAAVVLARRRRHATLRAMERLDRAARSIAQREALLYEARVDLDQALQIGGPGRYTEQLIGSFRLGNVLGRGANGEVYDAQHIDTGDSAAVKLLNPRSVRQAQTVHRFFREVRIASTLRTPYVVRVLEIPEDEAPVPYLAMERLRGETLADVLRRRRRLPIPEVLELFEHLCAGLEVAHAAGIVHRDLKPRNIFAHTGDGKRVEWKLLDFGVCKLESSETLSSGDVIGTPTYMAPEQARAGAVDRRADINALGVIAYRALAGRPAFSGSDIPSILYAVVHSMPPAASQVAGLPVAFDAALAVALAKDPEQRYATASELLAALRDAAAGHAAPELERRAAEVLRAHPWSNPRATPPT